MANVVGKLDIVWRTAFGERGRLQTSQLQRVVCIIRAVQELLITEQNCYVVLVTNCCSYKSITRVNHQLRVFCLRPCRSFLGYLHLQ